jgi:tetratricopeptide (TPR) repeat protein
VVTIDLTFHEVWYICYWLAAMWKLIASFLLIVAAAPAPARDKPENWLEVRSQHFTVVTNANEKTGRRVADQFERMRSVFHVAFPHLSIDNGSPIIVLAIRDEKDFRALEPPSYLAKGQLKLGGLFLRAPDKNYVLMRLDAEGEHPYSVIYHEYTHFLLSKSAEWLPLWLNEGLAQFYENTDIHERDVALGQPNFVNLEWLRQNRLLPMATLFTVDTDSPYYHEENKGSIFYAESWALTHYLQVKDSQENTHHLTDYAALLVKRVDPVTAATRAFGGLKQLQSNLEAYIRQGNCNRYFKIPASTGVDDTAFKYRTLTEVQADAVRADFLSYDERGADARPLLDHVLQQDPKNVSAHETMGFLEFRAGRMEEARKWYEKAVKLDSQSYLAHYYFAAISMNTRASEGDDLQIETSLRAAIKLNPLFAPPFERLASLGVMRRQKLDEAHMMILTAVQLDPENVSYRMTAASVMMQMERNKDAIAVLNEALRIAKSPEDAARVRDYLAHVKAHATAQTEGNGRMMEEQLETSAQANTAPAGEVNVEIPKEELAKGSHRFLVGTLQNVHCRPPGIDLTVDAKGKMTLLHSGNYYKIEFTAIGFKPTGDINPCQDLEGKSAKVEYVEFPGKPASAYVIAIEIHK